MIDLRSDTVTKPTAEMRAAMAEAVVGDDVYHDDPTVNELEAATARLLGKEAAVFVPTGSMSNQIAVRAHTEPGDLVLLDHAAHIILNEGGGAAALSGVTMKPLASEAGIFSPDQVVDALGVPHAFNPPTLQPRPTLLCIENTHNAGGGTIWPIAAIQAVCAVAREHGLALHLDGARLWHATAASGVSEAEYAAPFDTVNVCYSKGLGAPVGSALAGPKAVIDEARRFKQQFGGGMRQAGILAAAALHALENHREGLARDVQLAQEFARRLADVPGIDLDPERVESNIVRYRIRSSSAGDFATECHERGVYMLPGGASGMRAVVHRDLRESDLDQALDVIRRVVGVATSTEPA